MYLARVPRIPPRVELTVPFVVRPRSATAAHIIGNDEEANAVAQGLAEALAVDASPHDPVRRKYFHTGSDHLNGVAPLRHPLN